MSRNRFLKYINLVIAFLLIVGLGVAYWFGWRPLPTESGAIQAPVSAPVSVEWDGLGVPHITATNIEDAVFTQGFVTAQERMFQMDLARRRSAGELAEVLGEAGVPSDREARQLRLARVAAEHQRTLTADERRLFAAYARGVNYYLETNRGKLPLEFVLSRYEPRPWSVADSILVSLATFQLLTDTWKDDLVRQQLIAKGEEDKIWELYPTRIGAGVQPGSNAWVMSGKWTASGQPILANDPHLPFSVPPFWYVVHLTAADGLNVIGATIPGLPAIVVGHNARIAWGVTNVGFDVQDVYAERLDPATGRYFHGDVLRQAAGEQEWIFVRGGQRLQTIHWLTEHGPVAQAGPLQVAIRWTAAEPGSFRYPFLDVNRAGNWQEFRDALREFPGPAQNFVYADTDGNIGFQVTGRLPVRNGHDGSTPLDGANPDADWDGYIPFDELPSLFNPPSGLIVTANQNPFPPDYPYAVGGEFAARYRAARIRELLEARDGWRPDEMLPIQMDIHDAFLEFLARQAEEAYAARGARSSELDTAIELLRAWDGRMEASGAAPLIAALLSQHLRKAIAERASPGGGLLYGSRMASEVVENLLRERPADWFGDYDQLILRSLVDAVEEGRRMQGDDLERWQYGQVRVMPFAQPVVSRLPVIGSYFRFDPVPLPGSGDTVMQMTPEVGPSLRMAIQVGDWSQSWSHLMTGQSGQALSGHRRDQWKGYWEGHGYPLEFEQIQGVNRLELRPES